jgi:hypothetical protein
MDNQTEEQKKAAEAARQETASRKSAVRHSYGSTSY